MLVCAVQQDMLQQAPMAHVGTMCAVASVTYMNIGADALQEDNAVRCWLSPIHVLTRHLNVHQTLLLYLLISSIGMLANVWDMHPLHMHIKWVHVKPAGHLYRFKPS